MYKVDVDVNGIDNNSGLKEKRFIQNRKLSEEN